MSRKQPTALEGKLSLVGCSQGSTCTFNSEQDQKNKTRTCKTVTAYLKCQPRAQNRNTQPLPGKPVSTLSQQCLLSTPRKFSTEEICTKTRNTLLRFSITDMPRRHFISAVKFRPSLKQGVQVQYLRRDQEPESPSVPSTFSSFVAVEYIWTSKLWFST